MSCKRVRLTRLRGTQSRQHPPRRPRTGAHLREVVQDALKLPHQRLQSTTCLREFILMPLQIALHCQRCEKLSGHAFNAATGGDRHVQAQNY